MHITNSGVVWVLRMRRMCEAFSRLNGMKSVGAAVVAAPAVKKALGNRACDL